MIVPGGGVEEPVVNPHPQAANTNAIEITVARRRISELRCLNERACEKNPPTISGFNEFVKVKRMLAQPGIARTVPLRCTVVWLCRCACTAPCKHRKLGMIERLRMMIHGRWVTAAACEFFWKQFHCGTVVGGRFLFRELTAARRIAAESATVLRIQ